MAAPALNFNNTEIAFKAKTDGDLRKTYWLFSAMNNRNLVSRGGKFLNLALSLHLPVKWAIKATIYSQFCGGENIEDCQPTINALGTYGIGTILDYSVEGEKTERGFDATAAEITATIKKAAHSAHIPFSVFKVTGIAPFNLLEKKQAGTALSEAEKEAWVRVKDRVNRICLSAWEHQVRIFFDGEETWIQDVIDELCQGMMKLYNKERPIVYNTYQLYRKAALGNLKRDIYTAQEHGFHFAAKLVRGAYMEKERERAHKIGYPDPIQRSKKNSDTDFDAALVYCLDNIETVSICAGTHNENSCKLLADEMAKRGIAKDDERVYFSQLLGMSDNISYNLALAGYNIAKYVPYGPVKAVMPYLLRRAAENTSIAGQSSREYKLVKAEMNRRRLER